MRNIGEVMRAKNHAAIALDTLKRLEPVPEIDKHGEDRGWKGMGPSVVCTVPQVSGRIRFGRCEGLSELERAEHEVWLSAVRARTLAMSENEQKLRALMWAEVTLRRSDDPKYHDSAQALRNFLYGRWGVAEEIPAPKTRAESRVNPDANCPFEAFLWQSVRRNAEWQNDDRQQYRKQHPNTREQRTNV